MIYTHLHECIFEHVVAVMSIHHYFLFIGKKYLQKLMMNIPYIQNTIVTQFSPAIFPL